MRMRIVNNWHFIEMITVFLHAVFLDLSVFLLRNTLVAISSLILYSIATVAVKDLFFLWRIQNVHDLVIPDALLLQLFCLVKRLCRQLLLGFQIALCLRKVFVPVSNPFINAFHNRDQMIDGLQ